VSLPDPSHETAALITGASAGIGREFARLLAARGHNVVLVARRADRLEELAAELRDAHDVRAEAIPADLADDPARDELISEIDRLGLAIDVLVNNAGFGIYRSFTGSDLDREYEQLSLLIGAVVHLNAVYLPRMVARRSGTVINVSSTSAFQPLPGNGTYAASKAFVLFHSEALSHEVKGTGVTVTAVCPGPVRTEFQETSEPLFADRLPKFVWASPERVARDGLRAAERGKRTVIPGGFRVRAFFGPNRVLPVAVSLPVAGRLMSKEVELASGPAELQAKSSQADASPG
jgi:short-subunit dehydrogenase